VLFIPPAQAQITAEINNSVHCLGFVNSAKNLIADRAHPELVRAVFGHDAQNKSGKVAVKQTQLSRAPG